MPIERLPTSVNFGIVPGVARPKGHAINPDAFDAWLAARGMTRSDVAESAGIALNTLSGLTHPVDPHGASTGTAIRVAAALRVPPGALFWSLIGHRPEGVE